MAGNEAARTLLLVVLQNVAIAVLVLGAFFGGVLVLRSFGVGVGYSLGALGLKRPRGGYFVGAAIGFLAGLGAVVLGIGVNLITFLVFQSLDLPTERDVQGPFVRTLSEWAAENPAAAIPATIGVVVVFGPAVEEFLWRGAVFGGLYRLGGLLRRRRAGDKSEAGLGGVRFLLAAAVSSLVFAALHLEPVIIPALFVLAVLLCALYARSGSLLPPFVAHATFNSFTVLLILLGGAAAPV